MKTAKPGWGNRLLNAPYILWAAIFIIVPLIMVAVYAFTETANVFCLEARYKGQTYSYEIEMYSGKILKGDPGSFTLDPEMEGNVNMDYAKDMVAKCLGAERSEVTFTKAKPEYNRVSSFTFANIRTAFSGNYVRAFGQSLWLSVLATLISLVVAYPFAYALSRTSIRSQKIQMLLIMLPMWMNMLIRTYAWTDIIASGGILNKALGFIGLGPFKMLETEGAVVMGMVYNYLPYMILPIYTIMSKIEPSLLEAAEDLGCNGFGKLRRVIMPLSLPGVVSGIIMVFVPSISTFYISYKMSNGKITLIGDLIETQMKNQMTTGGLNVGAALSLLLMVIILICTFILNRVDKDGEGSVMV
ncbi:MAG: ABC transporter permease [Ruminococcaceae bacterium]|nr:ABC transporter permease [Oscillospiraceae bacterium]